SITVLETLRPPYALPKGNKTPSVVSLPPSVARSVELNSYAPKLIEPKLNWTYASPDTVGYDLEAMPGRVLVPTSGSLAYPINATEGAVLEQVRVQGQLTSAPAVA